VQAVVLAGGLATRMRPRTTTVPKSMLEVAGRPFVDWQLERLAACGVRDVVMCVAYLAEQIEAHVGDGAHLGVRVRWAHEGGKLLGTAGAIRAAMTQMPLDEAFLVTYGDSYLPFDYAEPLRILEQHGADCDAVMSAYKNDGKWDSSNVVVSADGERIERYEKGTGDPAFDHIDYGATAVRRAVLEALPAGTVVGFDAVQHGLAVRQRLRACIARDRFFEIGSPEGLAELDRHLRTTGLP
jgi:N-acetyl-alpha-D-muramate 1-phosphate uridylyltransferase